MSVAAPDEAATGDSSQPWSLFTPKVAMPSPPATEPPTPPRPLGIVLSNRIYVETAALSPELHGRLVRLAAFANPEFWEAQRMRRSVHGIPRVISGAERSDRFLALPRRCREAALLSSDNPLAIAPPSALSNPDSYRHARRQDLLLQSAGYRILRFLAPDIPSRLPSILDAILRFVSPSLPPSAPN